MRNLREMSPLRRLMFIGAMANAAGKLIEDTATGNPLVFTTDVAKPLKSLLIPFTPVQEGSGDPSPVNVRNLIPWTGLKAWKGDVNWNQLIAKSAIASKNSSGITGVNNGDGSYTVSGTASALFDAYTEFKMQANHVYYVTGAPEGAENDTYQLYFNSKRVLENGLLTKNANSEFKSYDIIVRSGTALSGSKVFYPQLFDLTLMFGETFANALYDAEEQTAGSGISQIREILPKKYYSYKVPDEKQHSYSLTKTDIVFPSPVYGGEHEAVSGKLMNGWVVKVFDGSPDELWDKISSGSASAFAMQIQISGKSTSADSYMCDSLKNIARNATWGNFDNWISDNQNSIVTGIKAITTVADWRAYLAEHPITVAYKLATPQEQTLTGHQITAIKGQNTLWSDADGSMTAVYLKKA